MSEENVRVAEQTYEAFARGDVPGVLENFREDVEWRAAEGLPWGGVHNGPNAVAENVFGAVMAEVDGFALNIERFIASEGDIVLVLGRYSGKGRRGGKPLDAAFAHVWELEDGKLRRFLHYTDTAKFNEALS
jgi:ketosteroid isomerase-like protein